MSFLDEYEPVEARIQKFWSDHPDGSIQTYLVNDAVPQDGIILMGCHVFAHRDEPVPIAHGFAHQRLLTTPPQKGGKFSPEFTSPFEVCETSAIGRALANAGYAPKGKRPSREEVEKAENQWFDVRSWIDPQPEEVREKLRAWWKEHPTLSHFGAASVPKEALDQISKQLHLLNQEQAESAE